MIEAMTLATIAPIATVITGVITAISLWIAFLTSRSSTSASRVSIMPSCAVSSPVRRKESAIGGNRPVCASGVERPPPWRSPVDTFSTASVHMHVGE